MKLQSWSKSKGDIRAHKMVAVCCRQMAGKFYERMAMSSDAFYRANPNEGVWSRKAWPMFIQEARASLARLLTSNMPDHLKMDIKDALVKDAELRAGHGPGVQINVDC